MILPRILGAMAGRAVRRPLLFVTCSLALSITGVALAAGLTPSTAVSTFAEESSPTYRATQSFYRSFGQEPVQIVVKGDLQQLLLSEDLVRLVGLEGCLAGRVAGPAVATEGGAGGPCAQLARTQPAKVVIGPGTFINETVVSINNFLVSRGHEARRLATASERVVHERALRRGFASADAGRLGKQAGEAIFRSFEAELVTLALRYGLTKPPSLTEGDFVSTLVFDPASKVPGTPRERLAYLFPSHEAGLISVRLRAGLSQRQTEVAIATIRKAVAMPQWRLRYGESYLITGEPVILSELSSSITRSVVLLLIGVALVMALTLGLVFHGRPRLLPLAVALVSTAITFGALAASGTPLDLGEVAVLPVLIGLAVDYAVQLQSRIEQALAGGMDTHGAVIAAARSGGPAIATAATACAGAILVLELSSVPMVRAFALLLVIGLAIALLCAFSAGSAAIALAARSGASVRPRSHASHPRLRIGCLQLCAAWRGAEQLVRDNTLTRGFAGVALQRVPRRPRLVLAAGAACAALGFGLSAFTPVQTDISKLVPQNMPSLHNLTTLERLSGVGGELDLMVSGHNLTKPTTIEWMSGYESHVLAWYGYRQGHGCGAAPLCPALSLPSLLNRGEGGKPRKLTSAEVNGVFESFPRYFSEEVISGDKQEATLAFGLRLMPLARQQRIIEAMRSALHPPPGVHATLVGLPVLAAEADAQVASPGRRESQMLLGIAAVAFVLLIAFRGNLRRALVPIAPVILASGFSMLAVLLLGVPLNPMSVTLGVLVVAISTEFSVLICERCREELEERHRRAETPERNDRQFAEALHTAYRSTGSAVAASAATAIGGFGVLALSDISMLRDFGLVTLIDLAVSLLGVLIVLPAALTLAYGAHGEQRDHEPNRPPLRIAWRTLLRRGSGARDGI